MSPLLPEGVAEAIPLLTEGRDLLCCLDYDGTLAPLAPTPDQAFPLPGSARVIAELAGAPGVRVAIVTGRSIASVRRLLDVPQAYYIGTHGLERRVPGRMTEVAPPADGVRAALAELRRRLRAALDGLDGVIVEEKGAALAVHYRNADPPVAVLARNRLIELTKDLLAAGAPITTLQGKAVLEVVPSGVSKGEAICALLADAPDGTRALYAGDDETDESAFARLPGEAITIRIGPETTPTRARYRLRDCEQLQRLLRSVAACRRARRWR